MTQKKTKNRNTFKHGAYSRELMMPGEKISDYEELRQAHYDEWVPDGITEQYVLDELVALRWRKRRVAQFDQINLRRRNALLREANQLARDHVNLMNLGERFSEAANAEEAEEILSGLSPRYSATIEEWIPRDKCQNPALWYLEVGKYLSNMNAAEPVDGPGLFVKIVHPDLIEREISRIERLDDTIDRKIKQLMQVKTAKQVFPGMRKNAKPLEPKLINPPARSDDSPALIAKDSPAISEAVVSPKSNQDASVPTNQTGIIIEAACIEPVAAEKGRSNSIPVKVDFLAKRAPASVEELNGFSALCKEVFSDPSFSSSPTSL